MWILGIAGSHNSGAALIKDGRVVVAVQTERLVRFKRQSISLGEMGASAGLVMSYCLRHAGIDLPDLTAIATCTPTDAINPRFLFREDSSSLARLLPRFIRTPHHLAHAEYALHYSPQEPCIALVCDGSGTFESQRGDLDIQEMADEPIKHVRDGGKESISAYRFDGANLRLIYRVAYGEQDVGAEAVPALAERRSRWLASLGHLWEWAALYCHGSHHEAGKVMGLAPFGDPRAHADLQGVGIDPRGDARVDFTDLFRRFRSPNLAGADVTGNEHYEDIAAYVQRTTNESLENLVRFLSARCRAKRVCYAGGVALNGITNEHLCRRLGVELHMNGSCEDNGTAIGAALAVHHALSGQRVPEEVTDYHGRRYSSDEIQIALRGHEGEIQRMAGPQLLTYTARALAAGKIVGWFQGRSEFGPRALGNRSILADPRSDQIQHILNRRVKRREAFRPYAPAVIEARAAEFFDVAEPSPVMLRVVPVRVSSLPGITHVDGTARVQTVSRAQNPIFHDLLLAFEAQAGVPVLLNTSFNIAGEPIVETPADALRTFVASEMDLLVMDDFVVQRPVSSPGERSAK